MRWKESADFSEMMQISDGESRKSAGCRVSYVKGFILILVALAVAISVGLLVHFLHPCGRRISMESSKENPDQAWHRCVNMSISTGRCLPGPIVCNTTSSSKPPTTTVSPEANINYRLPSLLVPLHYDIELRPDIYLANNTDFVFDGNVTMFLKCDSPTNTITFHRRKLNISEDSIEVQSDGSSLEVANVSEDDVREFHQVELTTTLVVGDVISVRMSFRGSLMPYTKGLYWTSYVEKGQTKYTVASQLESTSAREAFPCLDEPNLKATFNVTLWRKEHMIALSNMPRYSSEDRGDGWLADRFLKTSVVMPTYLVAFVVCDYKSINSSTTGGLEPKFMRYWARPGAIDHGHASYAESVGKHMFDFLETYFDAPFRLPKLDNIALPEFASGAMENWGLITYREDRLLFDPLESKSVNKAGMTGTMAHELVHMWLGNIVTCKWWSDIWLQEGTARFFQHLAMEVAQRTWEVDEIFVDRYVWGIMSWDSSGRSRPIYKPVQTPQEIAQMFDGITYSKGGAVIRMMRNMLGDATLHSAMKAYVQKYAYSSADHDEFLAVVDEQASAAGLDFDGYNMTSIIHTWIKQAGYPVVMVTRRPGSPSVDLTQSMFLRSADTVLEEQYPSPYKYRWNIHVTYRTNVDNETKHVWLHRTNGSIDLGTKLNSTDWIIANLDQKGFYRVNYDQENWKAITTQLEIDHKVFTNIVRAQLIEDAFKLSRAGLLDGVTPMSLTKYLTLETAYLPFSAFFKNIDFVTNMLTKSIDYHLLRAYIRKQVVAAYERLQWDEKADNVLFDTFLRTAVVRAACDVGYQPCVTEAWQRFVDWKRNSTDKTILRPDIRAAVLCNGVRYGSPDDWELVFQRYQTEEGATTHAALRRALSCSPRHWQLYRLFLLAVDGNSTVIRQWDRQAFIQDIASNPMMRDTVLLYVTTNHDHVWIRPRVIRTVAEQFNTREELELFDSFVSRQSDEDQSQYEKTRYVIKNNIQWFGNNGQAVIDWIREATA